MTEEENDELCEAILTEETVNENLSGLGWSTDGTQPVFVHLTLPEEQGYRDVSIISRYPYLEHLTVRQNDIEDLSSLAGMPNLTHVDVSYNRLNEMINFSVGLVSLDVSHNNIKQLIDLSSCYNLQRLIIDYNELIEIRGLQGCRRLKEFSCHHNNIERICGLDHLPLKLLNISWNKLKKIENLDTLTYLQTLELAGNKIRSLQGLRGHKYLDTVNLEHNEVIDLCEIERLGEVDSLRRLNLDQNPCVSLPDYGLAILFYVPQLTELDHTPVFAQDKVAAVNLLNPSMELLAAKDHIMHVVYKFLQPTRLLDITLPIVETPYPILVLVGPNGIGKNSLALKLVEEFPDYFGYAASHTTRQPITGEVKGRDYQFVSPEELDLNIKMGALYGLTLEAVESVASDSLACVVHMELEGVLTLKQSCLEPRYVLILPESLDYLERRLLMRGCYNTNEIKDTLERVDMYSQYNQDHPGFFDTTICSDDMTDTYSKLRQLVMEYLGVTVTDTPRPFIERSSTSLSMEPDLGEEGDKVMPPIDLTGVNSSEEGVARGRSAPQSKLRENGPIGKRTWSLTSLIDSSGLARSRTTLIGGKGGGAGLSSRKPMSIHGSSIVAETSLQRRASAAIQAISSYRQNSFLSKSMNLGVGTVPANGTAVKVLQRTTTVEQRTNSRPSGAFALTGDAAANDYNALPRNSPDSSDRRSSSSLLSSFSYSDLENGGGEGEERGNQTEVVKKDPDEINLDLRVGSAISQPSSRGSSKMASNMEATSYRESVGAQGETRRPGSSTLPVLPPIKQ